MKILKPGKHRLFEHDLETAKIVSEMLSDLEKNGMDAVRKYSRQFDDWAPATFQMTDGEIAEAIVQVSPQAIRDTDYCQGNVRNFARAQRATMQDLEVETRPGVILGHRHIPVNAIGSANVMRESMLCISGNTKGLILFAQVNTKVSIF